MSSPPRRKNRFDVLFSSQDETWQTPDEILERVRRVAPIALDPCTAVDNPTGAARFCVARESIFEVAHGYIGAHASGQIDDTTFRAGEGYVRHLVENCENGLARDWNELSAGDLVFCNPPYGRGKVDPWVDMGLASKGCELIYLLPNRSDTGWGQRLLSYADKICFIEGRLKFKGAENGAPFPSIVVYCGDRDGAFLDAFEDMGAIL